MVRRLLLLNGLCAFSIATYHGAAYGFQAMFLWTNRYLPVSVPNYDQLGSLSYYVLMAIRQLDAFAIPGFIFVSAYFVAFSARGRDNVPWSIVRSRIQTLLIPFILWTGLRFVLLVNFPDSIDDVLSTYYFIVLVFQFYVLSPFLIPIAQKNWKTLLLLSGLLHLSVESLFFLSDLGVDTPLLAQVRELFPLWFFPRRIFWFALGLVIGSHQTLFTERLARFKWVLAASAAALAVLTMVEYELWAYLAGEEWLGPSFRGISSKLFSLTFILSFVAFDEISLPFSRQLSDLGGKSLGIYLANIPVIYVVGRIMYWHVPWTLGNQLVYQSVLITVGLGIPLLLMRLMRQSRARWAYRYIFG